MLCYWDNLWYFFRKRNPFADNFEGCISFTTSSCGDLTAHMSKRLYRFYVEKLKVIRGK